MQNGSFLHPKTGNRMVHNWLPSLSIVDRTDEGERTARIQFLRLQDSAIGKVYYMLLHHFFLLRYSKANTNHPITTTLVRRVCVV
jgi:hypothetical protein